MWRSWLARAVWDREVEGSSPFTPTIETGTSCDVLFLNFDLFYSLALLISALVKVLDKLRHTLLNVLDA